MEQRLARQRSEIEELKAKLAAAQVRLHLTCRVCIPYNLQVQYVYCTRIKYKRAFVITQEYRNLTDWSLEPFENASLVIVGSRVSFSTSSSTSALECSVGSRGFPSWGRHQWTARVESASADGGSGVLLGVYISGSTFMLMEERHSFILLNCSSGRVLSRGSWGNGVPVKSDRKFY